MTPMSEDGKAFLADMPRKTAACERHGEFESVCLVSAEMCGRAIWSRCPTCAAERHAQARTESETKELAGRLAAWQLSIGGAGIPERFRDRRLSTYVATTDGQRAALAFAMDYAANFDDALLTGRSALFIGKPGTGKTHLAVGIGLEIMERSQRSVLFTTVLRTMRRVKSTWGRNSTESESGAIAALVFPDLLILDEVGVQFGSDTEKIVLFDILNERYERRRPTLMLSNVRLEDVSVYLGDRIVDRMREDGGRFVSFDWSSHRRQFAGAHPLRAA